MRFETSVKELMRAGTLVKMAVAKRTQLPILTHLLIQATDGGVRLTGNDLAIEMTATLLASETMTISAPGACCVPGASLLELLGMFPGAERVTATQADDDPTYLWLTCGTAKYGLHTLPAAEFPAWTNFRAETAELSIEGSHWLELVRRAGYCASDEESRVILTGMLLTGSAEGLAAASTDTHRLSVLRLATPAPSIVAILPTPLLESLGKIIVPDAPLTLTFGTLGDAPAVRAVAGTATVLARLIAGQFPAYERVMPVNAPLRGQVNRMALLTALKRLAIIARVTDHKIRFDADIFGTLTLTAGNEVGGAREEVELTDSTSSRQAVSTAWETAFDARYLIEALAVSNAETVTLAQATDLQPLLLTDGDERWASVIMPMQRL